MKLAALACAAVLLCCPGRASAAEPVQLARCPAADGSVPDGGCRVPYDGALVDEAWAAQVARKRAAAEAEARRLGLDLAAAQEARAAAEGRPSWGLLVGVAGGALVVGLVTGVVLALAK